MTPSATSSPIVLLSSAVDPAKAPAPIAADASAGAGGEDFQLLLAQAANGLLGVSGRKPSPADTTGKNNGSTAGSGQTASDDGNALPPLSNLLPLAPVAVDAMSGKTETAGEHKDKQTDEPAEDGLVLLSGQSSAQPQPLPPPPAGAIPASMPIPPAVPAAAPAEPADPAAAATAAPATAAIAATPANAATEAAGESGTIARNGIEQAASAPKKQTEAAGGSKTEIPPAAFATALAATDTTATANADGAVQLGAAKGNAAQTTDSDFDALIKQLDASSPSSATSASATIDSGRTVQQAARPYATAHTAATATVSVPVGADGWSDAITDKVMWFSANKINSAEIHLNPPDLGPIQVRISTQQDQASVYFTSQHAAVRDALDQALPRLRDMMGGQGIQLLDAGVGGQGSARQQEYSGNSDGRPRAGTNDFFRGIADSEEPIAVTSIATAKLSRAGIDAYA